MRLAVTASIAAVFGFGLASQKLPYIHTISGDGSWTANAPAVSTHGHPEGGHAVSASLRMSAMGIRRLFTSTMI